VISAYGRPLKPVDMPQVLLRLRVRGGHIGGRRGGLAEAAGPLLGDLAGGLLRSGTSDTIDTAAEEGGSVGEQGTLFDPAPYRAPDSEPEMGTFTRSSARRKNT
jgi:hypothetical protein